MDWLIIAVVCVVVIVLIILFLKWVMDRAQASIGGVGITPAPAPINPCPGLKQALDSALQAAETALTSGSPTPADVQSILKKAQDALDAYKACMSAADKVAVQVTIDRINAALDEYRRHLNMEEKEIVKDSDLKMP